MVIAINSSINTSRFTTFETFENHQLVKITNTWVYDLDTNRGFKVKLSKDKKQVESYKFCYELVRIGNKIEIQSMSSVVPVWVLRYSRRLFIWNEIRLSQSQAKSKARRYANGESENLS